jgi:exodeoxyribonuclease VII large subunit
VFTVSRLNREVRALLEGSYRGVWVEGEISNLSQPRSGHVYFTLKDTSAQLRCAMFRNRVRPAMRLRDGMEIVVRGQVSLYENRGEYQLIVEALEETGEGALRQAFEQLKAKLQAEGLFAVEKKRQLPRLPRRIGLITSPTGAAVRDMLHVLARRFPGIPVLIYPTPVQGADAADRIVQALALAGRRRDCDVLILGRGGGSLEDLQAFNEERVARAIRASALPVVSAVGHEVDVTIADFAADLRAATPSAAAELVVPDASGWRDTVLAIHTRLTDAISRRLHRGWEQLRWLQGRCELQHPAARLRQGAQRTDELAERLTRAARTCTGSARTGLDHLRSRLLAATPAREIPARRETAARQAQRLRQALARRFAESAHRLSGAARTLAAVSPLATLTRGYAIVERIDADAPGSSRNNSIVRSAGDVQPGDRVRARLSAGTIEATVTQTSQK